MGAPAVGEVMNGWEFLRWLIERHPAHCFVGSGMCLALLAHAVLSGIPITINRNVLPFKLPSDDGLKLPKLPTPPSVEK